MVGSGFGNIVSYVVVIGPFVHWRVISVSLGVFGFATAEFANCADVCCVGMVWWAC